MTTLGLLVPIGPKSGATRKKICDDDVPFPRNILNSQSPRITNTQLVFKNSLCDLVQPDGRSLLQLQLVLLVLFFGSVVDGRVSTGRSVCFSICGSEGPSTTALMAIRWRQFGSSINTALAGYRMVIINMFSAARLSRLSVYIGTSCILVGHSDGRVPQKRMSAMTTASDSNVEMSIKVLSASS